MPIELWLEESTWLVYDWELNEWTDDLVNETLWLLNQYLVPVNDQSNNKLKKLNFKVWQIYTPDEIISAVMIAVDNGILISLEELYKSISLIVDLKFSQEDFNKLNFVLTWWKVLCWLLIDWRKYTYMEIFEAVWLTLSKGLYVSFIDIMLLVKSAYPKLSYEGFENLWKLIWEKLNAA